LKAYEKQKIKRILTKLNQLIEALDEGDYWMNHDSEDEKEIEIQDWCGNDDMDWFIDEVPVELCILKVCRFCGRTLQETCKNCA